MLLQKVKIYRLLSGNIFYLARTKREEQKSRAVPINNEKKGGGGRGCIFPSFVILFCRQKRSEKTAGGISAKLRKLHL